MSRKIAKMATSRDRPTYRKSRDNTKSATPSINKSFPGPLSSTWAWLAPLIWRDSRGSMMFLRMRTKNRTPRYLFYNHRKNPRARAASERAATAPNNDCL